MEANVVSVFKAFIFSHTKKWTAVEFKPEFAVFSFQYISIILLKEEQKHKLTAELAAVV